MNTSTTGEKPELQITPLHDRHVALNAKMVPFAGFDMPVRYDSDKAEHFAVRERAGIFDVSHMGEFFVSGPQALALIQYVVSNDASKLEIGQAQYGYLPNAEGGIVDDLLVYKLAEEEYMLVVNASNIAKDWAWISKQNDTIGAELVNRSEEIALLAVQGPKATEALQTLTAHDLSEIKFYRFAQSTFAGVEGVIISATGYTGAGGFELYVSAKDAGKVWDAVLASGKPQGLVPVGLGARDTLRLEMGYCLYGNDIDDTTSPIAAGLSWVTKFSKSFISDELFKKQKEEGVTEKLVGFAVTGKGIPRQGYELADLDGKVVGRVTSGSMSPSLNKGIGLAYVPKAFSKAGTKLQLVVRSKLVPCQVVKLPILENAKDL